LGNSPSQVWRGIHEGLGVLKQGLIKRIGNGQDTLVWNHNWIPRDGTMRPIYCRSNDAPTYVCELIDRTNAGWIEDKLEQFFYPMDAEIIRNIPLSTSNKMISGLGIMIVEEFSR
jgi:hypothetical protein